MFGPENMTRRQIHQTIAMAGTLVFLACLSYGVLVAHSFPVFLTICGAYVGFLLLLSLVCWLNVPSALRHRPTMPGEFRTLRLGPISSKGEAVLSRASLMEDQTFGRKRHRLFKLEQPFPEGTWCCRVEEVSGEVVAYAITFESASSPVLDVGEQHGGGRFLAAPAS
jgi:hypothetical protein